MLTALLAEWTYPRIDPVLIGPIRWYGVTYILAFGFAYLVLRALARKGRWPVHPDRVGDVLFWGILGVFLGGRIGYMAIYAEDKSFWAWFKVRDGGMSFHGGLAGVALAYWIYAIRKKIRYRDLFDGIALASGPGIVCVRIANFINAELPGRPWDGEWAMRFPEYVMGHEDNFTWDTVARHPSQLYEALGEGLLLFLIVGFLMIRRGWGGGRVGAAFILGYGVIRFMTEFTRMPDKQIGYLWGWLTLGQLLCAGMVLLGLVCFWFLRRSPNMPIIDWSKSGPNGEPLQPPEAPGTPAP